MSVGEGIFLSALLLSVVILFVATKDRWNWKRIVKWGLALPVSCVAILALGIWGLSTYENRPVAQEEFQGIKLNSTPADVRFLKGEPIAKHSTEVSWVYDAHSGSAQPEDAVVVVQFRDDKIRHITYWANERQIVTPYLLGFSVGSEYDAVISKLGAPSHVSTSENGLGRLLSFEKYKVFFDFEQGKVRTYGIYNPTTGPMKFSKEAEVPASAASGANK
ncbi:MAG: hypothetical protein ABII81_04975 [Pseudomonadota bacterium]